MQATLKLPRAASYEDYLEVERDASRRHELIDGVIVAMAGGSDEHNALAGRLAMLIGLQLPGGCRFFSPDQRYWISARARSRYADGSVICGKPRHPVHDGQASTNPTIVVEVLSPSSEGDDDGEKRRDFQSLTSLQAYVLVEQDRRALRVYRRDAGGVWSSQPEHVQAGESVELPGLLAPILVDEVYRDILDDVGASLLR